MTSPTVVNSQAPLFFPETTSTLACTATSASVTLGINGDVLSVYNVGTADAFLTWGINGASPTAVAGGTVTASSDGGMPIKAGERLWLRVDPSTTSIQGVCAATQTATVRITRGSGQH